MEKKQQKIENPTLFFVVFVMLLVSIGVVVLNFKKTTVDGTISTSNNVTPEIKIEDKAQPLSNYFENRKNTDINDKGNQQYNPYEEICSSSSGNKKPAISYGTVCFH